MIDLHLIGIGTGNPDHVTLAAIRVMREADLILLPRKGDEKSDLADLRRQICATHLDDLSRVVEFDLPVRDGRDDYLGAVNDWHDAIAQAWSAAITAHRPQGGKVALLVWGDPSLYDSTLRIAERLKGGIKAIQVVPGITSLQVLTAAHAIPLNTLAEPVVITTGRQLRQFGWPDGATTVAVMLDSGGAFQAIDATGVEIWWGAYLGMPHEALIAGPLLQTAPEILRRRNELRAEHGWIMDIYILRKTG